MDCNALFKWKMCNSDIIFTYIGFFPAWYAHSRHVVVVNETIPPRLRRHAGLSGSEVSAVKSDRCSPRRVVTKFERFIPRCQLLYRHWQLAEQVLEGVTKVCWSEWCIWLVTQRWHKQKHQSHDDLVWLSRVKGYHLRFDPESLLNPVPHTCKICFNRRTADTDSVSISKKNVITTRSGRQVNPPKKLCLWLFMSLLFINSLLFNYLLCAFIIYPFIHPLFISCISAVHVILWYCCIYKCILYYKCVCACACVGVCRSEF